MSLKLDVSRIQDGGGGSEVWPNEITGEPAFRNANQPAWRIIDPIRFHAFESVKHPLGARILLEVVEAFLIL